MSSKANASKKKSQQVKRNPKRKTEEAAEISAEQVTIQDCGKNTVCSVQRHVRRVGPALLQSIVVHIHT